MVFELAGGRYIPWAEEVRDDRGTTTRKMANVGIAYFKTRSRQKKISLYMEVVIGQIGSGKTSLSAGIMNCCALKTYQRYSCRFTEQGCIGTRDYNSASIFWDIGGHILGESPSGIMRIQSTLVSTWLSEQEFLLEKANILLTTSVHPLNYSEPIGPAEAAEDTKNYLLTPVKLDHQEKGVFLDFIKGLVKKGANLHLAITKTDLLPVLNKREGVNYTPELYLIETEDALKSAYNLRPQGYIFSHDFDKYSNLNYVKKIYEEKNVQAIRPLENMSIGILSLANSTKPKAIRL
ncbi:MAG: hypothetical protein ACFFC7_07130 [Candidatus Hermodarchaeota archaeon]